MKTKIFISLFLIFCLNNKAQVLLNTNSLSYTPTQGIKYNGVFYFDFRDSNSGIELWKTDGTLQGTSIALDIAPGTESSSPQNFTIFKNQFFFYASTALYKFDGTNLSKVTPNDVKVLPGGNRIKVFNDKLFFVANKTNDGGDEVWFTDGINCQKLKNIMIEPAGYPWIGSNAKFFGVYNDKLYFSAAYNNNGISYTELWKTDGTESGTVMIPSLFSTHTNPAILNFYNNNLILYSMNYYKTFRHNVLSNTSEIPVNEIFNTNSSNFSIINNKLYFTNNIFASKGYYSLDLNDNIVKVSDYQMFGEHLGNKNNQMLFAENTTTSYHKNLKIFDVTTSTFSSPSSIKLYDNNKLILPNGKMIFTGDSSTDVELWITDWTVDGTKLLLNHSPASGVMSFPKGYMLDENRLYYVASGQNKGLFSLDISNELLNNEEINKEIIEFYPNPAKDVIYFSKEIKKISIYDTSGKLLKTVYPNNSKTDISFLEKGVYFISGTSKEGYKFQKKIIKN